MSPLAKRYLVSVYDDQTSPPVALQVAIQILAKKPAVVMGSAISAMCTAMIPAMAATKTLQWCFSPTFYPPQGGYTYASSVASRNLILGRVRYMKGRGMRKIGWISTTVCWLCAGMPPSRSG